MRALGQHLGSDPDHRRINAADLVAPAVLGAVEPFAGEREQGRVVENRDASVTTGIASHDIVAIFGPPDRATLTEVMISAPAQAANITYSGAGDRGAPSRRA